MPDCLLKTALRRTAAVGLLGGLAALTASAPAGASTLAVDAAGTLRFTAARGEVNHVVASDLPIRATVQVIDTGSVITVGAGCTAVSKHEARCPLSLSVDQPVVIDLRDGDDFASAFKLQFGSIRIEGGTGNDTIGDFPQGGALVDGGPGADEISVTPNFGGAVDVHGNAGDDHITARSSAGSIDGNGGNDRIDLMTFVQPSLDRPSSVNGGGGQDTITASGYSFFDLADGGSDADTIVTEPDAVIDNVVGGSGADTIRSSAAATTIDAGSGPDTVDGGGGRGGFGDTIDCGAGPDLYVVYADDAVTNCETPFTVSIPAAVLGGAVRNVAPRDK